jgi:hypothetical protein
MIRGVLETAIQSDLPGMVRAITSEDVYSFDGRRVLIPQGTMLTGEYRSALSRGQTRVFLIWTRLLRSDGVSLIINSYGTDGLGRSGLAGEVDRHFFERFGAATLLTGRGRGGASRRADRQPKPKFYRGDFRSRPGDGNFDPADQQSKFLDAIRPANRLSSDSAVDHQAGGGGAERFDRYSPNHQCRPGHAHHCVREKGSGLFQPVSRSGKGSSL